MARFGQPRHLVAVRRRAPPPIGVPSLLLDTLGVLDDFASFGGASQELVAWELGVDPRLVADAWAEAVRECLILRAPHETILGEDMWRLTPLGRLLVDVYRIEPRGAFSRESD